MAESRTTKRERGRPKGPVRSKWNRFLSALKDGITNVEIRTASGLSKTTAWRYTNRFFGYTKKEGEKYSLSLMQQLSITSELGQSTVMAVTASIGRMMSELAPTVNSIIEVSERIERAQKYLEDNADVVSACPKIQDIQDPRVSVSAVLTFLSGDLCYPCLDPVAVNKAGRLDDFLAVRDKDGRKICKRCGREIEAHDIFRWTPPRKRRERTLKAEKIGDVGPDPKESRAFRGKTLMELRKLKEKSEDEESESWDYGL